MRGTGAGTGNDVRGATCENCGTALAGAYCHACGQRAEIRPLTLRSFAAGATTDVFDHDSRALRTLRALVTSPGRLTREFIDGHRIRYVQPVKLYLLTAGFFFIVCAYRPIVTFDPATREVASSFTAISAAGNLESQDMARLNARGITIELFAERFRASVSAYMPTFLVGSVLLFALGLALLYFRSGRGFLEHVVFALHWAALYFLMMSIVQLVPGPRREWGGARVVELLSFVLAWIYLFLALRRVYRQSAIITLVKSTLLMIVFTTLLALWIVTTIAWSMSRI